MMGLLVFKERLKAFYANCSVYIIPVIRFTVGFCAVYLLNKNLGFMTKLNGFMVPVVFGLISSFLPYGAIGVLAAGVMLAHLFSVSLELTLITFMFLLVIMVLYYGFQPGDSCLLLLTPILFMFNVPYAIPLLVGLSGSLVSIIPVSCGVFLYYMIMYVKQNAGVLTGGTEVELVQKYTQIIKSLLSNHTMLIMIVAFAITILVVYIIKNLSIDYSWYIAIAAGTIVQLTVIFIGDFKYDISVSIVPLLVGVALSAILACFYNFFVFALDYSRTEYTQFEDDEYYYYVKAVPKVSVTTPDVKVKQINVRKDER